uniref:Uncharacterized protein n=1 Tax=Ectropis obliqua nucleopolyhedrovirus TaxID=59376 RepID=A0A8F2PND2_9ABAC|nr:hypothetical protein QF4000112 [Ectropis obliqua nucleopolyhedrovirus]UYO72831.1 hypothetical protein [Ectropis obliqua nucleopolyhedrovirus]
MNYVIVVVTYSSNADQNKKFAKTQKRRFTRMYHKKFTKQRLVKQLPKNQRKLYF